MTDQELRAMIRDSIARHAAPSSGPGCTGPSPGGPDRVSMFGVHASHLRLPLVLGGDENGACLIEPAVRCNHCGFCQSLGH